MTTKNRQHDYDHDDDNGGAIRGLFFALPVSLAMWAAIITIITKVV